MQKNTELSKQYDNHAHEYEVLHTGENKKSTGIFFEKILKHVKFSKQIKVLDLGCGAGTDGLFYKKNNMQYHGIDNSIEMLQLAKENVPTGFFKQADLSYESEWFQEKMDLVVSKYVLQTIHYMDDVYKNVLRNLKPQGYFIFLVVHPLRQFLEKKKTEKDYFKKEIVASEIFDRQITVYEPTHTMQEYLSNLFLENFEVLEFFEDYEFPAAEQINGDIYPTYCIIIAKKKS
jgi:SAM-dependent methyltransferase